MLQKVEDVRQERFLLAVGKLKLRFPNKQIVAATGYKSGIVSEYLNGKKKVSESFLRAFCEGFNLNYEEVFIQKPSAPGDKINRERAFIKVLLHEVATLKAELSELRKDKPVVSRAQALQELKQKTSLVLDDLESDD